MATENRPPRVGSAQDLSEEPGELSGYVERHSGDTDVEFKGYPKFRIP